MHPGGAAERGITVLVLTLDRGDLMIPLLAALEAARPELTEHGLALQVVVGDTGSTDPELRDEYQRRKTDQWLTVLTDLTYQFSHCNNRCAEAAPRTLDRLLLLNNDVVLPDAQPLIAMSRVLDDNSTTDIVGLVLDYPDGRRQHGGVDLIRDPALRAQPYHPGGGEAIAHEPGRVVDAPAVTGAAMMVRTSLWQRLGGLDERYRSECQDVDLCLTARRLGRGVCLVDAGPVVHLENATRTPGEVDVADRQRFLRRWQSYATAALL